MQPHPIADRLLEADTDRFFRRITQRLLAHLPVGSCALIQGTAIGIMLDPGIVVFQVGIHLLKRCYFCAWKCVVAVRMGSGQHVITVASNFPVLLSAGGERERHED